VRLGLGGLVIFSLVLLVATMIHWETFRDYHLVTLVWLVFYYSGPVLVPIAARKQKAFSARPIVAAGDTDRVLQQPWRTWLPIRGIGYACLAVIGVILADAISTQWPWPITPLELRVFMGQVAIIGWTGTGVLFGHIQWRQYRLGLIFSIAIGSLQLMALLFNLGTYNWSTPFAVILFLIFLEWVVTPLLVFQAHRRNR